MASGAAHAARSMMHDLPPTQLILSAAGQARTHCERGSDEGEDEQVVDHCAQSHRKA